MPIAFDGGFNTLFCGKNKAILAISLIKKRVSAFLHSVGSLGVLGGISWCSSMNLSVGLLNNMEDSRWGCVTGQALGLFLSSSMHRVRC